MNTPQPNDPLSHIREDLRPIAQKHGAEVVMFIIGVKISQQAAMVLQQIVDKHKSKNSSVALSILTEQYNIRSEEIVKANSWTQELLSQVEQEMALALHNPIILPPEGIQHVSH